MFCLPQNTLIFVLYEHVISGRLLKSMFPICHTSKENVQFKQV